MLPVRTPLNGVPAKLTLRTLGVTEDGLILAALLIVFALVDVMVLRWL